MDITLTIFAQALAFAGLIWIVATKIWPPLLQAIEERQQRSLKVWLRPIAVRRIWRRRRKRSTKH